MSGLEMWGWLRGLGEGKEMVHEYIRTYKPSHTHAHTHTHTVG